MAPTTGNGSNGFDRFDRLQGYLARFKRTPALLAVDFDQTLTREDSSAALIEAKP